MSDTTGDLVQCVRNPDGKLIATPQDEYEKAMRVLLVITLGLAAVLAAGLILQMLSEEGISNSYALLADSFLSGRLDVTECVDIDCAFYDGKYYVVFPPGPALVALPFVAVFGVSFAGFIALTSVLSGASLVVWWRILGLLRVERMTAVDHARDRGGHSALLHHCAWRRGLVSGPSLRLPFCDTGPLGRTRSSITLDDRRVPRIRLPLPTNDYSDHAIHLR